MATEFLTALTNLFLDRVPTGVENRLPAIDKAYGNVIKPSTETTWDNFTKGWKTYNTYLTSVGGAFRFDQNISGPDMTEGNITNNIAGRDTFPGYDDVIMPDYGRYSLTLANISGNIALDLRQIRNQYINDTAEDYPGRVLKGACDNMAQLMALCFYLDSSGRIIALDAKSSNTGATRSGNSVTITNTTDNAGVFGVDAANDQMGRRRRILPGMQVDVWKYDMSAKLNSNSWVVVDSHIDYFGTSSIILRCKNTADAEAITTNVNADANDIVLTPYTSQKSGTTGTGYSVLPIGYQQWARATGTLFGEFGDLDVSTVGSMYRSMVDTSVGDLIETELNQYIDTFSEATGVTLDTIFTTNGVFQDMLDNYGYLDSGGAFGTGANVTMNRDQSEAQDVQLGYSTGMRYMADGQQFRLETSHFMTPGQVYICKTNGGNFKRYQPPVIPGMDASPTSGRQEWDQSIEWLGKYTGDDIWMSSNSSGGGHTTGIEAPFMKVTQNGVKEPRGILLKGVNEETKIGTGL